MSAYLLAHSVGAPRAARSVAGPPQRTPEPAAAATAVQRRVTKTERTTAACVGGNRKSPICGNRKPHTLVVGGRRPAFYAVDDVNSEGAGRRCTDGRRGGSRYAARPPASHTLDRNGIGPRHQRYARSMQCTSNLLHEVRVPIAGRPGLRPSEPPRTDVWLQIPHHGILDQPRPARAADRIVVHERGHHGDSRLVDTAREPFDAAVAASPRNGHPDDDASLYRGKACDRHDNRSNPRSAGHVGVSPDPDGRDHEPHGRRGGHQDQSRERHS